MQKLFELTLPQRTNAGQFYTHALAAWENYATMLAGGFTRLPPCDGVWQDGANHLSRRTGHHFNGAGGRMIEKFANGRVLEAASSEHECQALTMKVMDEIENGAATFTYPVRNGLEWVALGRIIPNLPATSHPPVRE